MKKIRVDKILSQDRALFLAYDQGLEHGPIDFDISTVDPQYLFYIASQGRYDAVVLNKGLAEFYHDQFYKKVPLILKLNGKSNIFRGFPVAKLNCSVKKAVDLGADAVGFTMYVGSPLEPEIFQDFGRIQEEAHDFGLPVVAWIYCQGRYVVNELATSMLSYASRIGLELGADIINLRYNDKLDDFKWIVRCAGSAKVMVSQGPKTSDKHFLSRVYNIMQSGAVGLSVGKEVWQHESPLKITSALRRIVFDGSSVDDSLKELS